jgi:hypothetical protein
MRSSPSVETELNEFVHGPPPASARQRRRSPVLGRPIDPPAPHASRRLRRRCRRCRHLLSTDLAGIQFQACFAIIAYLLISLWTSGKPSSPRTALRRSITAARNSARWQAASGSRRFHNLPAVGPRDPSTTAWLRRPGTARRCRSSSAVYMPALLTHRCVIELAAARAGLQATRVRLAAGRVEWLTFSIPGKGPAHG